MDEEDPIGCFFGLVCIAGYIALMIVVIKMAA